MDWHAYVLIIGLVIIDYVMGVIGAVINKSFSSTIMRVGLMHKFTYVVAVVLAEIIVYLNIYLDLGFIYVDGLTTFVCIWISITEVGSILENLVKINPELADNKFLQIFTNDKKDDKDA